MILQAIYLLARGYNDIDCRLPLLMEFLKDKNYIVYVVVIPTNSGIFDPKNHEHYYFMLEKGIVVTSMYEFVRPNFFLWQTIRLYRWVAGRDLTIGLFRSLRERLLRMLFFMVRWGSLCNPDFISNVIQKFELSIVLVDEIIFHKGRSFFIDKLLEGWKEKYLFKLCAFSTGQDPYINLWQDKSWSSESLCKNEALDVPLLVPGPNDATIMSSQFPSAVVKVVGNPRFDKSWVNLQNKLAESSANIKFVEKLQNLPLKIVFMLSKPEYGVEVCSLTEAINRCANLDNAIVIVKPHTRGMSFGEIGNGISPRVIDGSRYSSSELIAWSTTILFTGSSIAFHALVLGKKVIYLKYCQKYASIYDDCKAIKIAINIEDVLRWVSSPNLSSLEDDVLKSYLATHIYNGNLSGMVCRDVKKHIESLFSIDKIGSEAC